MNRIDCDITGVKTAKGEEAIWGGGLLEDGDIT